MQAHSYPTYTELAISVNSRQNRGSVVRHNISLVASFYVSNKIGHFQITFCLCLKTSPCAKPFIWKWVWLASKWNSFSRKWFYTKTHFDTVATGNSEIANCSSWHEPRYLPAGYFFLFERHGDWINLTNGQVRDTRHFRWCTWLYREIRERGGGRESHVKRTGVLVGNYHDTKP